MEEEIRSLKARVNELKGMENKFLKDEQSLHDLYEAGIVDEEGRFIGKLDQNIDEDHNRFPGMSLF